MANPKYGRRARIIRYFLPVVSTNPGKHSSNFLLCLLSACSSKLKGNKKNILVYYRMKWFVNP